MTKPRKRAKAAGASVPAVSVVTNKVPGTILFLGDGRRLAFGESVEVTPEIAAVCEKHNGQAPS